MNKSIYKHIGVILFFGVLSFIVNKIPANFIISGGDFYQLTNINDNIFRYLFTWFDNSGQGQFNPLTTTYPFYYIQQVLFNIGLSYSQIGNFLIFQFLVGSFYSFYFSQKIILSKLKYTYIGPFAYSLNLTVITILFYPWIVTHHFLIYIFIPLLLATFISYLQDNKLLSRSLTFLVLIFCLSLPAYNNIGYLFALFFVEGLLLFSFILVRRLIISSIKKFSLVILLQTLLSLIIILPFLSSQYTYKDHVTNTKAFGGDTTNFLLSTSSDPLNTFRLIMDDWRYPNVEKEIKFQQVPYIYILLSSILSFVFVVFMIYSFFIKWHTPTNKNIFHILIIPYFFLVFLSLRLTPPFDTINSFFYNTLTLGIFRSPDKIFIFIPFFAIALFVISLYKVSPSKKTINIIYILGLLSILFLFTGGIVKQYLYKVQGTYQGIVSTPIEYYNIQNLINSDENINSILSIPYSVVNSINWSNYPKWGYVGHDMLHLLYNKNYISANSYDHILLENKMSLQGFSDNSVSKEYLIQTIRKFGGKYIIDHKDVEKQFIGNTKENMNNLMLEDIIKPLASNKYFNLYEVDEEYIQPLINGASLYFKRINPTKYKVSINIPKGKTSLSFLQSHNQQWKLYLTPDNNSLFGCEIGGIYKNEGSKIIECVHSKKFFEGEELHYLYRTPLSESSHNIIHGYANGWDISTNDIQKYVNDNYGNELKKEGYPKKLRDGKIDYKYYTIKDNGSIDINLIIYFKPQSYFYLGLLISGITFTIITIYILGTTLIQRRKNNFKRGNKI